MYSSQQNMQGNQQSFTQKVQPTQPFFNPQQQQQIQTQFIQPQQQTFPTQQFYSSQQLQYNSRNSSPIPQMYQNQSFQFQPTMNQIQQKPVYQQQYQQNFQSQSFQTNSPQVKRTSEGYNLPEPIPQVFGSNINRESLIIKIPIYRCVSRHSDHKYFFTENAHEKLPRGYSFDKSGSPFSGVDSSQIGIVEVHRFKSLVNPDQGYCYFVPNQMNVSQEWEDDGILCYLFRSNKKDTVPIYRQFQNKPYREVLNFGVESGGWKNIEIVGYGYKN